jgi:hypothetical protein
MEGFIMSTREAFINDVRVMPEELIRRFDRIWKRQKARIERERHERKLLKLSQDCRNGKNVYGPYTTAEEAIRSMLEE